MRFYLTAVIGLTCLVVASQAGPIHVGHKSSPQDREAEIVFDEHIYQQMDAVRLRNPSTFDHLHPFFGLVLTDPAFYSYYLSRWQSHPARFEHYHPMLWRVLDGKSHLEQLPIALPIVPSPGQGGIPLGGSGGVSPGGPLNPVPPPSPLSVVPEPTSAAMIVTSVILLLLARGWFRPRR